MWNPFSLFKKSRLLSASDKQLLVQAIQAAEKTTSGEIRVFVESHIPKKQDALERATQLFFKNKMKKNIKIYILLISFVITAFIFFVVSNENNSHLRLMKHMEGWAIHPFRFTEKDWVVKQYRRLEIWDLFELTRSCEGEFESINYTNYTPGQYVPTCGKCFWCKVRKDLSAGSSRL